MMTNDSPQLLEWFFIVDRSSPVASWILAFASYRVGWEFSARDRAVRGLGFFLGLTSFVAYVGMSAASMPDPTSWPLVDVLYRGGLTACIATGFCWTGLTPVFEACRWTQLQLRSYRQACTRRWSSWRQRRQAARRERERIRLEELELQHKYRPPTAAELEYRLASQRLSLQESQQRRQREEMLSEIDAVRDELRFSLDVEHKKILGRDKGTFRRKDFDSLITRALSGADIEQIRNRGALLMAALGGASLGDPSRGEARTLAEIAAEYQQQRLEINRIEGLTEEDREFLVTQINRQESQHLHRAMQAAL